MTPFRIANRLEFDTLEMSRSRRKRPFSGITTSDTEKQDKRIANRKLRRKVRVRLAIDVEPGPLPHVREVSDPWAMAKDGKMRFDPDRHPDLLRK